MGRVLDGETPNLAVFTGDNISGPRDAAKAIKGSFPSFSPFSSLSSLSLLSPLSPLSSSYSFNTWLLVFRFIKPILNLLILVRFLGPWFLVTMIKKPTWIGAK